MKNSLTSLSNNWSNWSLLSGEQQSGGQLFQQSLSPFAHCDSFCDTCSVPKANEHYIIISILKHQWTHVLGYLTNIHSVLRNSTQSTASASQIGCYSERSAAGLLRLHAKWSADVFLSRYCFIYQTNMPEHSWFASPLQDWQRCCSEILCSPTRRLCHHVSKHNRVGGSRCQLSVIWTKTKYSKDRSAFMRETSACITLLPTAGWMCEQCWC